MNANLATAIRTVVILILAWGIVLAEANVASVSEISRKALFFLVLSGVTTGLSWVFYFKALQLGNASLVAAINKLSLVLVVILAAMFLREPLTIKLIVGAFLITIGTILMIR